MVGGDKLSLNPSVDNKARAVKKVGNFSPSSHMVRMYMVDGLATTLSANGGGQGGKTGLYLVSDMDKKVIDKNFTEVEDGKYVTTTKERELLCNYHSPTQQLCIKEAGQLCS